MLGTILALLLLLGVPTGLILLQTNAALVLLALLAGTVVADAVYADVLTIIKGLLAPTQMTGFLAYIFVSLLPALILALWYRRSAGHKLAFQVLPALMTGLILYFIVYQAAPNSVQSLIEGSLVYPYLRTYKLFVLVGGVLLSIAVLMLLYHPKKEEK